MKQADLIGLITLLTGYRPSSGDEARALASEHDHLRVFSKCLSRQ